MTIEVKDKGEEAEISIIGEIGAPWFVEDRVGLREFSTSWDTVKGKKGIRVLINSIGGSIFDSMAMYNLIAKQREKVTAEVLGIAASGASIIALAGAKLVMGEGSYLMIHNPWGFAMGGSVDMRKVADTLDMMQGDLAAIYEPRTGLSRKEILAAMDAETWYTADEAVEVGFADEVSRTRARISASADALKRYHNVPRSIIQPESPAKPLIDVAAIAARAREVGRIDERLAMLGGR